MADFYISYAQADQKWAEWIAWQLESAKYSCVLRAWDFMAGSNSVLEMQGAVTEATRVLAVLSRQYLLSPEAQAEWAAAYGADPTGTRRKLVPIRVDDCETEGLLPQITSIDIVGLPVAVAKERLLSEIRLERRKPKGTPGFPGDAAVESPHGPAESGSATHMPRIWKVDPVRNRFFTGRKEELDQLKQALSAGRYTVLTQVLSGLGGVGKTQIAAEFCYRNADQYDVVWWVNSEEPTAVLTGYAALAPELGLPEVTGKEQDQQIGAVRRWLERNGRWLLVFDNVEDPAVVLPLLPRVPTGHVIITSRNQNWDNIADPLNVAVLRREEAIQFMCERLPNGGQTAFPALCELLGDLPLALEQAAAYIRATGRTVEGYIKLFSQCRSILLSEQQSRASDYRYTVATTWTLSLQKVAEETSVAESVISACSFLAPENVPTSVLESLLREKTADDGDATAPPEVRIDQAISTLRRYSLIDLRTDRSSSTFLSVHRLVQWVVRDRLSPDARLDWMVRCLGELFRAFPRESQDPETWSVCTQLLPHVLVLLGHVEEAGIQHPIVADLFDSIGTYFLGIGQFQRAQGILTKALDYCSALPKDPRTLSVSFTLVRHLAVVYSDMGDHTSARRYREKALAIAEAVFEQTSVWTLAAVADLAETLSIVGDFKQARVLLDRGNRITESAHVTPSLAAAAAINNLGRAYERLGEYETALKWYTRALLMQEQVVGPDHRSLITPLANIGLTLKALQRFTEALEHHKRALRLAERSYQDRHPTLARAINNVGHALEALGSYAQAREHYERTLVMAREIYGERHPEVATTLNNLGTVSLSLGDIDAAENYVRQAMDIDREFYGDSHPELAIDLCNLGNVHYRKGNLSAALEYYQRSVSIMDEHDRQHAWLIDSLTSVASINETLGNLDDALNAFRRVLPLVANTFGQQHANVADINADIGRVYAKKGQLWKAKTHLRRALELHRAILGETHLSIAHDLHMLGDVESLGGNSNVARECYSGSLSVFRRHLGADKELVDMVVQKLQAIEQ